MTRRLPHLLLIAGLAGVTGCGLTMTGQIAQPGSPGSPPGIGDEPSITGPSRPVAPPSGGMMDEVCRSSPRPRGWIAVAYRIDPGSCSSTLDDDNPYNVAVIQRYHDMPVGAVLEICADQRIPTNWMRDREPSDDDGCPGARVAEDAPTSVVIRRIR